MTVLDIGVSSGSDDALFQEGNSSFSNTSTVVAAGYGNSTSQQTNSFMRFVSVGIPNGQLLDVAYVTGVAANNSLTTVNTRWAAIDADNAAAPTTYTDAQNATRTTATVDQNSIPAWTADTVVNSPGLVTIVEEVVARGGWAPGNAIVIYWEDNGSTATTSTLRRMYSYDFAPSTPPTLHVEYTPTNTAPTITVAPTASYGSLTRLGPNNTPAVVTATATDPEETGSDELTAEIRDAASGGGTLVATDDVTSGVEFNIDIPNSASGISEGSNTLYLRVGDGTAWSSDSSFTLLVDRTVPGVGDIDVFPDVVVEGS